MHWIDPTFGLEGWQGVLRSAGELAREYGPAITGFYEDMAIPLLR